MNRPPIGSSNDSKTLAYDPDGSVGKDAEGRLTLTFKRYYPHSVQHVWAAIIDPQQNRNWLGKLEFEPKVGGKVCMILDGTDPVDGTQTTGEILNYSPPHELEYWVHALEMETVRVDAHINRWALSDAPDGCVLEFTHTFAEGERARNSIACGWHAMLEQFETTVAGETTDWSTYDRDRMTELYWHYRNKPRA